MTSPREQKRFLDGLRAAARKSPDNVAQFDVSGIISLLKLQPIHQSSDPQEIAKGYVCLS